MSDAIGIRENKPMSIDLHTKSILVIDDMVSVRTALRHMLASLGISDVDFASDGDEGLKRMEARSYDIVLCDYNLGEGRDGMQILEEAKQRHLIGLHTIFAMITAESSAAMVLGVVEYRPDDYFVKPVTRQMLQERLSRLVARKKVLIDIERVMRSGDLTKAVQMTAEQLREQPAHTLELMQIQVDLLIRLGQFETASTVIEAAASVRETFWVKLGRGQVCYYLGDYEGASAAFSALIAENHLYTEVYDWLARVHLATGDLQAAKENLATATKISPRSIRRAQTLGEVSLRTDDAALAEQAYRNAVRLGRFSVYHDPNDSARLAQVLLERGNLKDASRVLKDARRQYRGSAYAALALAISEASTYHRLSLSDAAMRVVDEAIDVYQDARDALPPDLAIELARLCHIYDRDVQAAAITTRTVFYYIEEAAIMNQAREVFCSLGMAQAGTRFIDELWKKVAVANSEGVRLINEGKLRDAQTLLEKAAEDMSFNSTTNINAARVLLMIMEKQGRRNDLLGRAKQYLDRVPAPQAANDDKFLRLRASWTRISHQDA
ncbi:putative Response regulator [Gammaproteobacteria bacterium]